MKAINFLIILFISISIFSSCNKEQEVLSGDIIGAWQTTEDYDYQNFTRTAELEVTLPGMEFHENGKFLIVENSGFCGTPPIHYSIFEGTWVYWEDTIIEVTYEFWGGTTTRKFEIVEVNQNILKIVWIYE